jgi:sporulation protein YlmC with PRC-barrel domain
MFSSKDRADIPLISVTDGKKVGEIKDLYIDQDMRQATAVFLGREGVFKKKTFAVPRNAIQLIGKDAWLLTGSTVVAELEDIPDSITFILIGDLRGREIQSEGGTKIGIVDDVILDENGRILGFALGKVFVQGPLAEKRTIARDAITNIGSEETAMTTVLEKAESMEISTT